MHLKLTYDINPQSKKKIKVLASLPLYGLVGYINSNYTSNQEDKKLVMGYCFFIHKILVL